MHAAPGRLAFVKAWEGKRVNWSGSVTEGAAQRSALRPRRRVAHLAFCALVAACLVGGCTDAPAPAADSAAAQPPLLPAQSFTAPGIRTGAYLLSPDGNKLTWTGSSMWRATLFVRDRRTGEVRSWRARGNVQWTGDSRRLLYVADTTGRENPHVYAIDTESSADARDLTPHAGVKAAIHQLSQTSPKTVLVTHNRLNPKLFDLYSIDLETGIETLVARNPGNAVAPITRPDGALRGWQPSREAARSVEEKRVPQAERTAQLRRQAEGSVRILGPGPRPQEVWALSNRGRDRSALVRLHVGPGWEEVVFEDPVADVSGAAISAVTRMPLLAWALPGYPRVEFLDDRLRADLEPLLSRYAGRAHGVELSSADRSEQHVIVGIDTGTVTETFLLDRGTGTVESLGRSVPPSMEAALAPMQPVSFSARDGLALHGYLALPHGVAARGLPMVLLVHGGPWARTQWADPMRSEDAARAQFLANRGYAVLQVDFRGSTGYGSAHTLAGIGEFAGRMQDDLIDAVEWAKTRGIADPARIAIMGLSYGGYAAMTGLALTPRTFACGISIGGPTDLASLIESFPPYWTVDLSNWHDFVGNPQLPADRADMTRRSPLTHAGKIERPLLIIHGARDVRVRLDQSQRMVAAMTQAGRPVRFVTLPDMGHNPSWWAHQYQVLRETETFLADCLGGRAQSTGWFDAMVWIWTRLTR